jgi:hypothetical protein
MGAGAWETGGRGVHSEGVYRGYIRPLVLVNGGWDYMPLPCFCVLILSSFLFS